jgi:hypothetical protein
MKNTKDGDGRSSARAIAMPGAASRAAPRSAKTDKLDPQSSDGPSFDDFFFDQTPQKKRG